jgi:acyl-CoA synthetase (AMP-forming)/AMP-acid ligase II
MSEFENYLNRISGFEDAIAFATNSDEVSYRSLVRQTASFQEYLISQNVLPTSIVAVVGDFSAKSVALIFALFLNNNVVVPISIQSSVEVTDILRVSGCDWFVDLRDEEFIKVEPMEYQNTHAATFYDSIRSHSAGLVLFSSGTSGKPKGIVHEVNRLISRFNKAGKSYVSIPLLMFDHFGGYNTIFGLLGSGGKIVILKDRTTESIATAVEHFKVTLLPTTPSFLALLLASRVDSRYDFSSLQKISYGTEVMPESLLERLSQRFPEVAFQQTYGLSELGVLNTRSMSNDSTWVQVGGAGYESKVVDGQLWIKSNFSMLGYISDQSSTPIDEWFNTQDRVEVNGDFIKILGRDSDLINVGGQKVFPQEIEDVLLRMKEISSVRVSGELNDLLGQIVRAEISLLEGMELSKGDVRAFCKEHLINYKVPQKIDFVDDIPLTHRMKKGKT